MDVNLKTLFLSFIITVFTLQTYANPEGGQVSAGQATISSPDAKTVQIQQASDKAVIDWRTFNINSDEKTQFIQSSTNSIALNRVDFTHGPSTINGNLSANGQIWLVSPAGIVTGPNAHIDVGGLLMTTASISNQDFMSGHYHFVQSPNWNGAIINNGSIAIKEGGLAALVAPGVENNGVIRANLGKVALAAGTEYTVDFTGDQLIQFALNGAVTSPAIGPDSKPLGAAVSNKGKIIANGGTVLLTTKTAQNVLDKAINMDGYVEAKSAAYQNGEVVLLSEDAGVVEVSGKINASGTQVGQTGGTVKILGKKVLIADKAKIKAAGAAGGGEILIGGNAHGTGPELNADYTSVGNAKLNASALTSGNGGKVVVWSDLGTQFNGQIAAHGGNQAGNGGWVETSGKDFLAVTGNVDASALHGQAGQWLLDPANITISSANTKNGSFNGNNPDIFTPSANGAFANVGVINSALNSGTSVTIQTGTAGTQAGTITLQSGAGNQISKTSGGAATLTLNAADNITLSNSISATSGALNVDLISGNAITINGAITTNGGNFLSTAQNGTTLGNANGSSPGSINAGAGTVTFNVNADGVGANSFLMNQNSFINTTNTTNNAVAINVNTANGTGTGSATLRDITTGSGGKVTVNVNTGPNITYGGTGVINVGTGSIDLRTAATTGANIGTSAAPLQVDAGSLNLATGSSGIYIKSLSTNPLLVNTLQATGVAQIIANGVIFQGLNPINVTTLILKTLSDAGAGITFNNSNNLATTINLSTRNSADTDQAPGAISYQNANGVKIAGIDTASTFDLTAGGSITQTGGLTVDGLATFSLTAPNADLTLTKTTNDFNSIKINNANNVAVTDANALNLDASTIGGTLKLTTNGSITQSGALVVSGNTTLLAGAANDITLTNTGNDFSTVIVTSGKNVALTDSNNLVLGATKISGDYTINTQGDLTQSGAQTVAGLTTINTNFHDVTLTSSANNFNTINIVNGNNVSLRDANSLTLNNLSAVGDINLSTVKGDIQFLNAVSFNNGNINTGNNGNILFNGSITGGSLTLNSGSLGDITFNGVANLGNLTVLNTYDLTNNSTLNVASYQQNAGNNTFLGNHTLNSSGDANITSNSVTGNMNVAGNVTINAQTVNGTANVGALTLNVTGSLNLTGSVGGLTGDAAAGKITYLTAPQAGQTFNGVSLLSAQNPIIPTPPPTTTTTSVTTFTPQLPTIDLAAIMPAKIAPGTKIQAGSMPNLYQVEEGQTSKSNISESVTAASATKTVSSKQTYAVISASKNSTFFAAVPLFIHGIQKQFQLNSANKLRDHGEWVRSTLGTSASSPRVIDIHLIWLGYFGLIAIFLGRKLLYRTPSSAKLFSPNLNSSLKNIINTTELIYQGKFGPINTEQKKYLNNILMRTHEIKSVADYIKGKRNITQHQVTTLNDNLRLQLDGVIEFAKLMQAEQLGEISPEIKEYLNYILHDSHAILHTSGFKHEGEAEKA